ncbi:MAG: pyrroline-5-carboxylate reductase [Oscillospiraceae bacterium]|nr:pyrroline-5-carboxylate reductase [Oscillospiraceae bacterium]
MPVIGFIGTGNMGGALAKAAAKGNNSLLLYNRTRAKAEALAGEIGGTVTDCAGVVAGADYLFLGVKPQMLPAMAGELAPLLKARGSRLVLVTMMAGVSIERLLTALDGDYPVIRIMPNTPAAIGQGMILYSCSTAVTAAEEAAFVAAMAGAGRFLKLEERLIDAGSAVSGSGPAFADLFIEALADGGVACGLPRKQAQEMAAQMLLGSAALVLESGRHPGALKDAVCSPGGTTIQGVRVLEERGFRGAVMDAVISTYEKNLKL